MKPTQAQRDLLELLSRLGPHGNTMLGGFNSHTKSACERRGWIIYRPLDRWPGVKAWHILDAGRVALGNSQ